MEKKSFPEGENKSAGETAGEPEKEKQARKPSLPDRLTTNIKEVYTLSFNFLIFLMAKLTHTLSCI